MTNARLHIIKPMGFEPTDKHLKRSGLDYWHYLDLTYYESFDDFFAKCPGQCFFFSTKAQKTYSNVSYPDKCCIVFGREDKGLPEELLFSRYSDCVRIPMLPDRRSLNLSNSVAIAAYEVLRQWNFPELENYGRLTEFDWSQPE